MLHFAHNIKNKWKTFILFQNVSINQKEQQKYSCYIDYINFSAQYVIYIKHLIRIGHTFIFLIRCLLRSPNVIFTGLYLIWFIATPYCIGHWVSLSRKVLKNIVSRVQKIFCTIVTLEIRVYFEWPFNTKIVFSRGKVIPDIEQPYGTKSRITFINISDFLAT